VPELEQSDNAVAPTPEVLAQATPKGPVRSYDEMNTGQMVFELQGTVGELKESIASLTRTVQAGFSRAEGVERVVTDIKTVLGQLVPKIDDVAGFVKHGAPNLATKHDLEDVRSDLKLRPTRRQAIFDVGWVVALITGAVTLGSHLAH
jgi:hypothetical protein